MQFKQTPARHDGITSDSAIAAASTLQLPFGSSTVSSRCDPPRAARPPSSLDTSAIAPAKRRSYSFCRIMVVRCRVAPIGDGKMRQASGLLLATFCVVAPRAAFAQAAAEAGDQGNAQRIEATAPYDVRLADPWVRESRGFKSKIGRMFTGAVVGGWLGFFASHVAVSDWETGPSKSFARGGWAAGGMILGAVVGRLTTPGEGRTPPAMRNDLATARAFITREEIVKSGTTNAYEVVRSLRNEWLIPRGVNSINETARGSADEEGIVVVPGSGRIVVYLDQTRLGGIEDLEEVAVEALQRLEFVDGPRAVFRWGAGHAHGVIQLHSLQGDGEDDSL